jgi:hypothetical protein
VILLGGWLLMHPPLEPHGPATEVPITKWDQYGAFDTARDCERGRLESLRIYESKHGDEKIFHAALVESRCVPTEVVYPPPSPSQK